jgi:colanic acid/amylovoran biosynthesis glycosyltransferase
MLFVGRLVEKKGIGVVLDAFAQVHDHRSDAVLHIVGDGPLRALVDQRAAEFGSVIVHGAQPPDFIQELMKGMRLLVLPSQRAPDGDVEGFGLVLAEAQALGLPVVTANFGGTLEAIVASQTGLAVDPTDSRALAAACLQLLGDDVLAGEMGMQAYAHARQHFDLARQTPKLEAIYDDVLARATAR